MSPRKKSAAVDIPALKVSKPRMAFGAIIREYRLKAHLDQEQVGNACGVTAGAVSTWERNVAQPDCSLVPTLCQLLDIPLYDFFEMKNPFPCTAEERALIETYRSMNTPSKRQLHTMINAMTDCQAELRCESYKKSFRHLDGHDLGLAAGFGGTIDDEPDTYPVFVRINRESRKADDVFLVSGQSMEPDYPDGSMVYVERLDSSMLRYGEVVACIVNGIPYVKVYEREGLHSLNPKYADITINDGDTVRLYGRVIGLVDPADIATDAEAKELTEVFADELK